MYHFLIDPEPWAEASVKCTFGISGDTCTGDVKATGRDDAILAQRAAFLRPDSLVAIVILSDENDASFRAEGDHWITEGSARGTMRRGTSGCASVPGDADDLDAETLRTKYGCEPCAAGSSDPACSISWPAGLANSDVDGRNVRAFDNVRRYGRSSLYPVKRYVEALSRRSVLGSDGVLGPNPLFVGDRRSLDMVVLAGIVGVPRGLVENADATPRKLTAVDWEKIASNDPSKRDPHMIESIAPRAGLAKFMGDRSVDPVHGGDRDVPDSDDLQYACIAKRLDTSIGNACEGAAPKSPLCEGAFQSHFKAYPGLRILRAIRDLGDRGHVASICAESYQSIVAGIAQRIQIGCFLR